MTLLIVPVIAAAEIAARTCTTAQGLHELFTALEAAAQSPARLRRDRGARIVQLASRFDRASVLWDFRSSPLSGHSEALASALAYANVAATQLQHGKTDLRLIAAPIAARALSRAIDLLAGLDCREPTGPLAETPTRALDLLATSPAGTGLDLQIGANTRVALLGTGGFVLTLLALIAIHLFLARKEEIRVRYLCNIPATLRTKSHELTCVIHDISRGGAKLTFADAVALEPGMAGVLTFAQLAAPIDLKWHRKQFYGVQFKRPIGSKAFAAALHSREAKAQRRTTKSRESIA